MWIPNVNICLYNFKQIVPFTHEKLCNIQQDNF